MRKLLLSLLTILCASACAYAWKPIFAGHRGGYTGVQNTVESYRNGVDKYGYTGLECDVRVTADGKYVISHDETTNSLGGSLTVAESTLDQLKAETLTQTRGGVTYTGHICTVEEYLDICVEKSAFPVIELKWATGINNNDMSNFAGLVKLVKARKLESKAVFLTSMKQSIEYIRTNYPDLTCQFLTGQYWANHFDWCVKWKVNPSIQIGYFDIYTVKKFHDAGLKVAMWTVNSEANYTKYGNMGVYMMTCDYLYPSQMPELDDIDWNSIPDKVQPLVVDCNPIFRFSQKEGNLPENFPISDNTKSKYTTGQQAAYYNGTFYVNDYGTSTLLTYNSKGAVTNELKGTNSHGIATDDAGNLILRSDGITASPSKFLIYKNGSTEGKELVFSLLNNGQTNFITASGDIFSKDGGYVYFFPNKLKYVYIVKIADGKVIETTSSGELSFAGSTAGYVIPINNDPSNFIYQVRNQGYNRYIGKDLGAYLSGGGNTTAPNRNSSVGGAFFVLNGHDIFVHCSGANYNGGFTIRDMSADGEPLHTEQPIGTIGYTKGNVSCGSFFAVERIDENSVNLYEYCMAGGYAGYRISMKGIGAEGISADEKAALKLAAYPNPATDAVTLNYADGISTIAVYSITGSKVISYSEPNSPTSCQLDVSSLPAGLYLITVNGTATARLIKQ